MGAHVDISREPDSAPQQKPWESVHREGERLLAWERELLAPDGEPVPEGYGAHRKPGPAVGARGQIVPRERVLMGWDREGRPWGPGFPEYRSAWPEDSAAPHPR